MKLTFVWGGHPISKLDIQSAESDISGELKKNFGDFISFPVTVHLSYDLSNCVISGIIVDSNGKSVLSVTRLNYHPHSTTFEEVLNKNKT